MRFAFQKTVRIGFWVRKSGRDVLFLGEVGTRRVSLIQVWRKISELGPFLAFQSRERGAKGLSDTRTKTSCLTPKYRSLATYTVGQRYRRDTYLGRAASFNSRAQRFGHDGSRDLDRTRAARETRFLLLFLKKAQKDIRRPAPAPDDDSETSFGSREEERPLCARALFGLGRKRTLFSQWFHWPNFATVPCAFRRSRQSASPVADFCPTYSASVERGLGAECERALAVARVERRLVLVVLARAQGVQRRVVRLRLRGRRRGKETLFGGRGERFFSPKLASRPRLVFPQRRFVKNKRFKSRIALASHLG